MLVPFVVATVAAVALANAVPAAAGESCSDLQAEVVKLRARVKQLEEGAAAPSDAAVARSKLTPLFDEKKCEIDVGDSPVLGKKGAKLQVVFFMDIQGPFDARLFPLAADLVADPELKGKVAVVWKDFPLSFHQNSRRAAVAARAAKKAGGDAAFFDFVARLFDKQKTLDVDQVFYDAAIDAKVPMQAFRDAWELDGARFDRAIHDDTRAGEQCHVRGTPSVFVNGFELRERSVGGVKALAKEKKLL